MRPVPARPVQADRRVRHRGRGGELVDAVVGSLVDPQGVRRGIEHRQAGDLLDRGDPGGGVDRDPLQDALGPDRSDRDEHCADPVKRLGEVGRIVQAGGTDVQPARVAEGAVGFAGVADKRGDLIAAHEQAAHDLAADVARSADHCGGHRVSSRSVPERA
jgi:hypothetical protein